MVFTTLSLDDDSSSIKASGFLSIGSSDCGHFSIEWPQCNSDGDPRYYI